MTTKTERWNLRVTPDQDEIVRRVLELRGESLNEYVVRSALDAACHDLAERQVYVVDDEGWDELQAVLSRPPRRIPELAKLLSTPSVLEQG